MSFNIDYQHFVWATKYREPFLTPELEPLVHTFLREHCAAHATPVLALNGMPDHIHLVVNLHADVSKAAFTKNLKGSSSRYVRVHHLPEFQWQRGYASFSVSEVLLDKVVAYVDGQKAHHRNRTIIARYERLEYDKK